MNDKQEVKELASAVKKMLEEKYGEFRADDLIEVCRELGLQAWERAPIRDSTGKMQAYKHIPEIIGINLEYAIETYDWEDWRPMTSNGITVTGFWDLRKGDELPEGYEMDLSGRFLKMKTHEEKIC